MSSIVLKDVSTYLDGFDLTTHTNSVDLNVEGDVQDVTCFRPDDWREKDIGLMEVTASMSGIFDTVPDAEIWARLDSGSTIIVTQTPEETEGRVAYMYRAAESTYNLLGAVGEVTPFNLDMVNTESREGLVRGRLAAKARTVSAPGVVGSAVEAGAVTTDRFLYVAVHCFAAGTTLSLDVESDSTSGFASPTVVASLPAIAAVGGRWMTRVPAPITDTWYRLTATAVTGSFTLAASIGVG